MIIPDFRIKGTKLPVIPLGTIYSTSSVYPHAGETRFQANDFVSYGFLQKDAGVFIKAESEYFASDNFYLFEESLIKDLYKKENAINEIPERWCIKITTENQSVVSDFFNKNNQNGINDYHTAMHGYLHFPMKGKVHHFSSVVPGYEEISYGQFEKCVLLKKETKSKIIGYKIPYDIKSYGIKAGMFFRVCSYGNGDEYTTDDVQKSNSFPREIVENWEPVYEDTRPQISVLYFGNIKFTLNALFRNYNTEYGTVSLEDIEAAINYFTLPPKICGYAATVHTADGKYTALDKPCDNFKIGFGCVSGTLEELIKLRDLISTNTKWEK